MGALLHSESPLLILAAVLFLMGAGFDLIFSEKFKSQIRTSIAESGRDTARGTILIRTYADYFASEILSQKRIWLFVVKGLALSTLFFIIVLIFQVSYYLNRGDDTADVQYWFPNRKMDSVEE